MGNVGCLVGLAELILGCIVLSVLKVDLSGVVNKSRVTSCFGLQVVLGGSLCVSVPCTLHLSCGTCYKLSDEPSY